MQKLSVTLLLAITALLAPKLMAANFPIVSHDSEMIFSFSSGGLSFAPGSSPLNFRAYIRAPDGKRTNGPTLTGRNALTAFNIIVKPPILFGTYSIVFENMSIPSCQVVLFNKNVFVTTSVNTKIGKSVVAAPMNTPSDPGDTVVGYFNPVPTLFAH